MRCARQAPPAARDPLPIVTFAELHDRLTAAGVEVGLERDGHGLALIARDWAGARELRLPVRGGDVDGAARVTALSVALREACGGTLPPPPPGRVCVGRWPELAATAA